MGARSRIALKMTADVSPRNGAVPGLIAKLTVVPGRREEMVGILKESAADMPGCFSYVVAKDSADENAIWVTEVWDSIVSHDCLSIAAVCEERHTSG